MKGSFKYEKQKKLIIILTIMFVIVLISTVIFVLKKNYKISSQSTNDKYINIVKSMESNGLYTYNPELKSTKFEYVGEVNGKYLVKTDKYDVYIDKTNFSVSNISYDLAGTIENATLKDFMSLSAFGVAKDKYIINSSYKNYNNGYFVYGDPTKGMNPSKDIIYDNKEIVEFNVYEGFDDPNAIGKILGKFKVNFKTKEVTFIETK